MFRAIAETPVMCGEESFAVCVGVEPGQASDEYDLYVLNGDPLHPVRVGHSDSQGVGRLLKESAAHPERVADAYHHHRCIDDCCDGHPMPPILPSFESVVVPDFVDDEAGFREKQTFDRVIPYATFKAVLTDEPCEASMAEWVRFNAPIARFQYPQRSEPNDFSTFHFCPEGKHYWVWQPEDAIRPVRSLYVAEERGQVLPRAEHPGIYQDIMAGVCPLHNTTWRSDGSWQSVEIPVTNIQGIHMRPTSAICDAAQRVDEAYVGAHGRDYNAKSVMDLLQMRALFGDTLLVRVRGDAAPGVLRDIYRAATTELH